MLDLTNIKKWILARRSLGEGGRAPQRKAESRVDDSLDAFGSESSAFDIRARPVRGLPLGRTGLIVGLAAILTVALAGYALFKWRPLAVEAASASLTIESVPAGADVLSGGAWKGKTPLTLSVTPGEHNFELLHDGHRKPLRAVAQAGAAVVHHVEFDLPGPEAKKASLRIATEPSSLRVVVDGVAKGTSPLTVEEIAAGKHTIQVFGASGRFERDVEVAEGESAAVIITALTATAPPPRPAGPSAGWLTVASPVALQIIEGRDIIGTSASSRIMLPTGRHELVLTNAEIGFTEKRIISITAGESATVKVQLPNAPLSINAVPWAEVWVDGVKLGETPIGNHSVRLGPHEVVFRHPELGERRQTVTVTATKPARVSVDMRKSGS